MEPETMVVLAVYESADIARVHASSLVEHGIGATVEPVDSESGDGQWALRVLPGDATRARGLLGLSEPPDERLDDDRDLTRSVRSVLVPVLVGLAALVVVPLIAFFVSYKLSGG